jgi:hypothetical protein
MASVVVNARTHITTDLSCAALQAVFSDPAYPGYTLTACSVSPLAQGVTLTFRNLYASPPYVYQTVTSVSSSGSSNTNTPEQFDYTYASAIWSLAFTTVVGLYLVSKNVGLILALIRGR